LAAKRVELSIILEHQIMPEARQMSQRAKRKVISLFSGCGGLDLGFEGGFEVPEPSVNSRIHPDWVKKSTRPGWVVLRENSFETIFANDIKPSAKASWNRYFCGLRGRPPGTFALGSIVDIVRDAESGLGPLAGARADVVTGGFPCQDFSLSGKRRGFRSARDHAGKAVADVSVPTEETRGMLYFWMRKVIDLVRPRCFVAENVKGMVSMDEVKETIENDFRSVGDEGYLVMPARVLRAQDYGVPQTRERVIFLGFDRSRLTSRAARALGKPTVHPEFDPYPVRTHAAPPDPGAGQLPFGLGDLLPHVTVGQALEGLGEPSERPFDAAHLAYSRAKWFGRHCQGQKEVDLNAPGPTIRSEHHGNIEFRRLGAENGGRIRRELSSGLPQRRLSVRECARIQGFPDDMELVFGGSGGAPGLSGSDGYKLVGNAVPPLLGYHIARRLEHLWAFLFGSGA
jgi:DNA (cytosine-5)-methyltransferase 1